MEHPLIVDPSQRRLPVMDSMQDALRLNKQENTTFYVAAFLFQAWLCELTLANIAQLAERPDPNARCFQNGEAWRGFQKFFGKCSDPEFPELFGHLMQFADCDDPMAQHLLKAAYTLSVEHDVTGDFLGRRTPASFHTKPRELLVLMRSTTRRLCDWLEAACHYQVLSEWHLLPNSFDPDPKKRELTYLANNKRHFDLLDERSQAHWLKHMSDLVDELGNSPEWATYRQVCNNNDAPPRPWPTNHLDHFIIKLWPLMKRYKWSPNDFLFVLRKVMDNADLAPCPNEQALVQYCSTSLSLRQPAFSRRSKRSNQASSAPRALQVALRLCVRNPETPEPPA